MSSNQFVHLNNHSDYSLQRSISTVEAIVERAKELGQPAVALTDYGNLFAVPEFVKLCKKHGIKPIIGCECFLVPDMRVKDNTTLNSLILLCKNKQGFENLKKISSMGYLEGFYYFPRIDISIVKNLSEGLLCIIPQNDSVLGSNLEMGKVDNAKSEVLELQKIFGENLYLEIQNHGLTFEYQLNQQISSIGKDFHISLVAGNDCHYIYAKDSPLHEIFISTEIKGKRKQSFSNDQYYFKSREEMEQNLEGYIPALDKTLDIMNLCEFEFKFIGPQLPSFTLPQGFSSEDEYLRALTKVGIQNKYKEITQEILDRAEFELNTIISMGFSGYFLIVWDIITFAHKSDIPVGLGRGSAAGSIVAYALGITDINPLKYGLLFERFLNPERVSMPDIDTDFCVDRRQDVIDYIRNNYGYDNVSQIITFSQLKPKGALRDVARAMNVPLEDADMIAKLIPFESQSLKEAEELEPKLKELRESKFGDLFNATEKIVGLHRHASLHAAGIVIAAGQLTDYVPLYRDPKSEAVATQYSMKYLEDCGLVKMDILGLRTLTIIENAVALIKEDYPDFLLETIPEDDKETFKMLSEGNSASVFQFESGGMQKTLQKVQPTKIEDLIALNALYRPGPMKYIDDYAAVKQKQKKAEYVCDALIPILEETYGIIVYQEQVMQIARDVAGYTLANADLLRRAMGKKDAKEMERQLPIFIEGAKENGFSEKVALDVFNQLAPFAEYGFNKSHSAAYAILAYQTAYLKCHYSQYFMVSCINSNANRPDELTKQLKVCKSLDIKILPPDINHSDYLFTLEGKAIRYGFIGIKGMSDEFKQHIPEERKKNGAYKDVLNCLERLPSHKALTSFLKMAISCGLFDSVEPNRLLLCINVDMLYDEACERIRAKLENRFLLFADEEKASLNMEPVGEEQEMLEQELLNLEREYLGIYLSRSPLDPYKELWKCGTTFNTREFQVMESQKRTDHKHYIIGYIDKVKKSFNSSKGRKTLMGNIEDYNGSIPFLLITDIADQDINLEDRHVYGFTGHIQRFGEDGDAIFRIVRIYNPEELVKEKEKTNSNLTTFFDIENQPYKEIHLRISSGFSSEQAHELSIVMRKNEFLGETRVFLHTVSKKEEEEIIALPPGFTVDARNKDFIETLKSLDYISKIWYI